MINVNTLGSKILVALFAFFAGLAVYLPFLEAFALTPAIAFVHRFSITFQIGSLEKTLQPILFVIPILFIKGALEYNKIYGIKSLAKSKIVWAVLILLIADLVSVVTSVAKGTSLVAFTIHAINIMVFLTSSMWLKIIFDMLNKQSLQKAAITIVRTFVLALGIFTIVNTVVSISQFADCSFSNGSCHIWKSIDSAFPNRLLEVGHQKFSYETPIIIRTPGFFGDVNFNGMFSLLVAGITATVFIISEILKTKKGYAPQKEQLFMIAVFASSIISFLLTFSRSAILGFVPMMIGIIIAVIIPLVTKITIPKTFWATITKFSLGIIAGIIIFFLVGFAIPLQTNSGKTSISGKVLAYIGDAVSAKDSSTNGHLILFQDAMKIAAVKPVFGHGIGTYSKMYQQYINPLDGNSNPHSTYAMLYAEQGIFGLVIYVAAIIFFWYLAIKSTKKVILEIAAAFAGEKKLTREFYMTSLFKLALILITFGVPFYSLATTTYYGFFLPMTWWWGTLEN